LSSPVTGKRVATTPFCVFSLPGQAKRSGVVFLVQNRKSEIRNQKLEAEEEKNSIGDAKDKGR